MSNTTFEFTRPEIAEYLRETFELPGIVERQCLPAALWSGRQHALVVPDDPA